VSIVEYNTYHKSNSHLHRVNFTFKYAPSRYLDLYPSLQEIRAKCLVPGCESWLHFSIFCKQLAIRALHMGSKEMETTAHNIGNVGKLVNNLPAIILQPITSRLAVWRPMIYISVDRLQSTWLARDLHHTLTRSNMTFPG